MSKRDLLLQVVRKIPVFHALPPSQVQQLVRSGATRSLETSEVLCRHDTPSDEMYILLAGELAVITAEGLRVATLKPVTSVGEMGVITGQPRTATVSALADSRVLTIRKSQLEEQFDGDPGLRARMLRNFIGILAERVTDDNLRMRDFEHSLQQLQGRAAGLEKRIRRDQARVAVLTEVLETKAGMAPEAAREAIDAGVIEHAATVLVVDDEADFRQLVRDALEGTSVVEAQDGAQALSTLETLDPDLVITDIRMPGVDGLQLVDRIRSLYPRVPVVGVSGHVDVMALDDRGFAGFVEKPVAVQELRRVVDRALALGRN
jgi:CheY-like chemotaxis protein